MAFGDILELFNDFERIDVGAIARSRSTPDRLGLILRLVYRSSSRSSFWSGSSQRFETIFERW
jgi:hypothetical protein